MDNEYYPFSLIYGFVFPLGEGFLRHGACTFQLWIERHLQVLPSLSPCSLFATFQLLHAIYLRVCVPLVINSVALTVTPHCCSSTGFKIFIEIVRDIMDLETQAYYRLVYLQRKQSNFNPSYNSSHSCSASTITLGSIVIHSLYSTSL